MSTEFINYEELLQQPFPGLWLKSYHSRNWIAVVDVDVSQISKPNPVQQTEINERMHSLGEKLKGKVTIENRNIVVARVNGETITASNWYWEKINKILQAEFNNKSIPSDAKILNDLIETHSDKPCCRRLRLFPPSCRFWLRYVSRTSGFLKLQVAVR